MILIFSVPKPNKYGTRKEICRLIYLMCIDVKVLDKVIANQIPQHIKKIIHLIKLNSAQ
jgi:hypothetical protein